MSKIKRRAVIAGTAALVAGGNSAVHAASSLLTPAQTEGPFYPLAEDRVSDSDFDLVRIAGAVQEAGGEILHLTGTVHDENGAPVAGAVVEIWQCDVNGRYHHSQDAGAGKRDLAFQGFGKALTGADGSYRFRTIRPVSYPGRTPHIHVKVKAKGRREFTTQMYVAGERLNAKDFLYNELSARGRKAVTVELVKKPGGELKGDFAIVLG